MKMNAIETEQKYMAVSYPKKELVIARGKGSKVWDNNGREYIDCNTGVGVAILGHCNDYINEAVIRHMSTLATCPDIYYFNDVRAEAYERLAGVVPKNLGRFFFCNSGTESVEAAIKFVRYNTGRSNIIAMMRGFHGRTAGSLSLTWNKKYKNPFLPLLPDVEHVPFNDLASLRQRINGQTAAVILEPVQGESGVIPADKNYLSGVRELCTENDALLIMDEAQTGFGRTGEMFASQLYGIEPDVMCMAKGMTNGIPMGAVAIREDLQLPTGLHGTTFGGNTLACAALVATLDFIEKNNILERSREMGAHFLKALQSLEDLEVVREVRGLGLMLAMELKTKNAKYLNALIDNGVLALPAGNTVIRFLPPLTISRNEIDSVLNKLRAVF